jgi:hypothetical protein
MNGLNRFESPSRYQSPTDEPATDVRQWQRFADADTKSSVVEERKQKHSQTDIKMVNASARPTGELENGLMGFRASLE